MEHRKRRKPTYFYVNLEVNRVRFSLRLIDISYEGAKLSGIHEVVDGTKGVIEVRGQKVDGMLRWVHGNNIGFEFDERLPERLYALLSNQKQVSVKKRFLVEH